jgi:hypothetical protein
MWSAALRAVIERTILCVILFGAAVYAGDYLSITFRIPNREPVGSVEVEKSYAVKQKNGKLDYYFDPPEPEECVRSLFPHFGDRPCWYVERHKKKRVDM